MKNVERRVVKCTAFVILFPRQLFYYRKQGKNHLAGGSLPPQGLARPGQYHQQHPRAHYQREM